MKYNNIFETRVTMYVYEEIINNEKLTDIINNLHENVKYLPGHKLPENVASILKSSSSLLQNFTFFSYLTKTFYFFTNDSIMKSRNDSADKRHVT